MLTGVFAVVMFVAAAIAGVRAYRRPYELSPRRIAAEANVASLAGPAETRSLLRLESALLFALGGYLFFDRAFAWIHVPGTPLFVGELVMQKLRDLDDVAYIRFASVYRDFKDVSEFVTEARPMLRPDRKKK